MVFVFSELLALLIIIGLCLLLSAVWPPDSPWAPWWQMPDDVIASMCTTLRLTSKDIIYDLGCGTGKALLYAAKKYNTKGVGIEIDPIRVWLAKWNIAKATPHSFPLLLGPDERSDGGRLLERRGEGQGEVSSRQARTIDVTILKKNFFDVDISPASIIFVYLVPKALGKLLPKFLEELQPGVKIASYIYDFPDCKEKRFLCLINYDKQNKIYFYKLLAESQK